MEISDIVARIHQAGIAIADCIKADDLSDIARWYEQRQVAINELVSCYPAKIEKATLRNYLQEFAQQDQDMIMRLSAQRTELQKTLKSFQQLRHYISV